MTKEKISAIIPLTLIAALLAYCWTIILVTEIEATWRQYLGLALFIGLVPVVFKTGTKGIFGLGVYLLIATFNGSALTPTITTTSFGVGRAETPPIQLLSLALLVVYLVLNFEKMANVYLDYKEGKRKRLKGL